MKLLLKIFGLLLLMNCQPKEKEVFLKEKHQFAIDSEVRALAFFDNVIGFAGSKGVFGLIDLHKLTINHSIQKHNDTLPDFRAVTATPSDFFMLSAGSPALLYKTERNAMKLVYYEAHQHTFYNAMAFEDTQRGIAIGDANENGRFSIIETTDGGNSWHTLSVLPESSEKEHLFSASNSCLLVGKGHLKFVTGGAFSHFYTYTTSKQWQKYQLPLQQGSPSKGAFSLDFFDEKQGIVAGGDYQNPQESNNNLALTFDGGITWENIENTMGYISCIKYLPQRKGNELIATGSNGIWLSWDKGRNWKKVSNEGFHSIVCISAEKFVASKNQSIKIFEIKEK